MNLKPLITSLLLVTTSIAAAETGAVTTNADHLGTWIALTEPMGLSRGRDVIRLGGQTPLFTQLRFQATTGSSHLERVIVKFVDGSSQTVDLNAKLGVELPMIQFTLDGTTRRIEQLIVIGASSRRAAVQLFGM